MRSLYLGFALITGLLFASCSKSSQQPAPPAPAPAVYVAGYEVNSSNNEVATLWKNGVATRLADGTHGSVANAVFVKGTDIYVAGSENGIAKVWKNGVATNLTDGTSVPFIESVYVNGNDVYVAGSLSDKQVQGFTAILWKNGLATNLPVSKITT